MARKDGPVGQAVRKPGETRELVARLLGSGHPIGEVARELGITPAAVSYHARKLGIPPSRKYAPRGDWPEIQAYYDAGHSLSECEGKFGFSRRSWNKAVTRGDIVARPQGLPIHELLVAGRERNGRHVKRRLLASGLREMRCEECGVAEWLDEPLTMALHHVNGNGTDHRLDNLRLLCPNCHSQTANFARRAGARS